MFHHHHHLIIIYLRLDLCASSIPVGRTVAYEQGYKSLVWHGFVYPDDILEGEGVLIREWKTTHHLRAVPHGTRRELFFLFFSQNSDIFCSCENVLSAFRPTVSPAGARRHSPATRSMCGISSSCQPPTPRRATRLTRKGTLPTLLAGGVLGSGASSVLFLSFLLIIHQHWRGEQRVRYEGCPARRS